MYIEHELVTEGLFEVIAQALEVDGYLVLPNGMPEEISACLQHLEDRLCERFYAASIGRGPEQSHDEALRSDKIAWIHKEDSLAAPWHQWTADLQRYLNRRLFLGLFSFESHLAVYEPGDFYRIHVDAFRGQSNRRLSLVAYLNPDWQSGQGGELVIYHPQHAGVELRKVAPLWGTLVVFLSEEFPHEVLPTIGERKSVAGWFRVNGSTAAQADPPT